MMDISDEKYQWPSMELRVIALNSNPVPQLAHFKSFQHAIGNKTDATNIDNIQPWLGINKNVFDLL